MGCTASKAVAVKGGSGGQHAIEVTFQYTGSEDLGPQTLSRSQLAQPLGLVRAVSCAAESEFQDALEEFAPSESVEDCSCEAVAEPAPQACLRDSVAAVAAAYLEGARQLCPSVEQLWALGEQAPGGAAEVSAALTSLASAQAVEPQQRGPVTAGGCAGEQPGAWRHDGPCASQPDNRAAVAAMQAQPPTLDKLIHWHDLLVDVLQRSQDLAPPWKVIPSNTPLQLAYKHEDGVHSVKATVVLPEPVLHNTCLVRETDLIAHWNGAFSACESLGELSEQEMLVYQAVWTPWPLSQPEVYMTWNLFDLVACQERAVVVVTEDLGVDLPAGLAPLPHKAKRSRMFMHSGVYYFKALPPDPQTGAARTQACVMGVFDDKIMPVPALLVQFMLRVLAPLVYRIVESQLRKLFHRDADSEVAVKLRSSLESRALYVRLQREVAAALAQLQAQQQ